MIDFNPYAYEVHEDPYPFYRRLRAQAPVYRHEALGFWALARHRDVLAALKDTATFSNANGVSLDPAAWGPRAHLFMSFLAVDPPRHTRMRALVSRGFTPRRVRELEPRIREIATKHLDALVGAGGFDAIADFAGKLPMDVISEMLGVPEADRAELRAWADLMVHREEGVLDVPPEGIEAWGKIRAYFVDVLAERRARRGADLVSALLDVEMKMEDGGGGERLTDDEILSFCNLMIVAGNETTTKLIGNALHWLARNPLQRAKVDADPSLVPAWVEETLRYDNSTQMLARTVARDLELEGRQLRAGDRVLLLIGSANRDEAVFPEPEVFDLGRDTSAMVSFGQGAHFCLGASLARLEGRIALEEWQRRFRGYELERGAVRVHSVNVRGFAALPVRIGEARIGGANRRSASRRRTFEERGAGR